MDSVVFDSPIERVYIECHLSLRLKKVYVHIHKDIPTHTETYIHHMTTCNTTSTTMESYNLKYAMIFSIHG